MGRAGRLPAAYLIGFNDSQTAVAVLMIKS